MPYSIMLDAGHGGSDPGAVYNGRKEKDDTLELVMAIGDILKNNGVEVDYTRTSDVYQSPYQKAMLANEAGVDFFVSIHRNSFPTDNVVSGVESLVYNKTGIKYELAQEINEQLETIGFVNLGVNARPNLVVLRRTKMPAVLVEVGFINSDVDNKIYDENFETIARAIADGILDVLEADKDPEEKVYSVQTGAFRNPRYAQNYLDDLVSMDFPAIIEVEDGYYKVQVGRFQTLNEAVQMEQRLKRAGYPTLIVT